MRCQVLFIEAGLLGFIARDKATCSNLVGICYCLSITCYNAQGSTYSLGCYSVQGSGTVNVSEVVSAVASKMTRSVLGKLSRAG